jgi:hypothetical protein
MHPTDALYNLFEAIWCFVIVGIHWFTLVVYQTYINAFRLVYDYVSSRGHGFGMYIK